jgi:Sep-tRNA:Cys-tRNA synthetase
MTQKQVEKTFQALYALEDLRELWRKTTPHHKLTPEQKRAAKAHISKVRSAIDQIEREL